MRSYREVQLYDRQDVMRLGREQRPHTHHRASRQGIGGGET